MKERPIIFSRDMVRAIVDGTKTQTRRVLKPWPTIQDDGLPNAHREGEVCMSKFTGYPLVIRQHKKLGKITMPLPCPYGAEGDRLWVRETWGLTDVPVYLLKRNAIVHPEHEGYAAAIYKADGRWDTPNSKDSGAFIWCPSIHMPRWASRITLEIVNVRVERLQDISDDDVSAEGIGCRWYNVGPYVNSFPMYPAFPEREGGFPTERAAFEVLWDSINAKRGFSWDMNPFVWVIEFRRVEP